MSKRILAVLLTICMVLSFSGCGKKETEEVAPETIVEKTAEESEKEAILVNEATYTNGDSELNCVVNFYEEEDKIVWTFIYKATDEQDATTAYEQLCITGVVLSKTLKEMDAKHTNKFGSAIVSLPDGRYIVGSDFMTPIMAVNSDGSDVYMEAPDWYNFLNADSESETAKFIEDSISNDFLIETLKK